MGWSHFILRLRLEKEQSSSKFEPCLLLRASSASDVASIFTRQLCTFAKVFCHCLESFYWQVPFAISESRYNDDFPQFLFIWKIFMSSSPLKDSTASCGMIDWQGFHVSQALEWTTLLLHNLRRFCGKGSVDNFMGASIYVTNHFLT